MSDWETLSDEASIVVLGSFNPRIFHPEWFIRKGIIEEWDFSEDKTIVVVPDMAQLALPDQRDLLVLLNKYQLKSSMASNYSSLKDLVSSTFAILPETPVTSMGMNFHSIIKISDLDHWKSFGQKLAPRETWIGAIGYVNDLDDTKQLELGLWDMTMNIPRNDDLKGFMRARLNVEGSTKARTIRFSMNSHVELGDKGARMVPTVLKDRWDNSLEFAKDFTSKMMESGLGGMK